jgi:hypothetical protein
MMPARERSTSIGPDGDLANPVIPVYELTGGHLTELTG